MPAGRDGPFVKVEEMSKSKMPSPSPVAAAVASVAAAVPTAVKAKKGWGPVVELENGRHMEAFAKEEDV